MSSGQAQIHPKTSNMTMQPPSAPMNSEKENPLQESTSDSNPTLLKSISTHAGTPWPRAGKMSGNLFELKRDWLIPPACTSNPPIKIEPQPQGLATPSAATVPKAEKCGWGPNCPICKNIEEDWDGDYQNKFIKIFQTFRHKTHSNHNRKTYNSNLRCKVSGAPRPKTIKSHKTYSISKHETHNAPATKFPTLLITNI